MCVCEEGEEKNLLFLFCVFIYYQWRRLYEELFFKYDQEFIFCVWRMIVFSFVQFCVIASTAQRAR